MEAIPLDKVLASVHEVKLLKIDVEGSEYEVLKGLKGTLNHTKFVILELSRKADACLNLIQAHGFKCKKMKFTSYYLCYREKM